MLAFAAATYLSVMIKQKLIPAIVSGIIEFGTVIILLFKGASLEELFLMVLIFGCTVVLINYYFRKNAKSEADDAEAENDKEESAV